MIKKLISAVAAAAIAITAFAGLASAEKTYDIRLDSGVTFTDSVDSYGSPYFTVWCDDLAGEYTSTMQIQIEVISGEIGTDVSNFEFGVVGGLDSKRGLYTPGRSKTYLAGTAFTQNVTTTDGKQFINVSWGSSAPAMTDDGMLFEFYVTPKDAAADLEFEINGINLVNTCTSTNGDKVNHFFEPETAPQYVLKAGTSMVSEKSSATPTPTATATPTPTPVVTPEPTPTVEPTPEVTPEPTTGKGAITADASDAAAWAWKTAAAAGSEVEVTVKADDKTATKAFALKAAVDGTVKVGVIVQYNPANFTSFEIVDINVK